MDTRITTIQLEYDMLGEKPFLKEASPRNVWVKMPDGVNLYTVLYIPEGEGPFPTILMRSCYPCDEEIYKIHGREYSKRGFAFVYQFCRGTGLSEGDWVPNIHEKEDGIATLKWLGQQSWMDVIGYFGCSYLALTGWVLADYEMDCFKTLYLTHYGTDRYVSAYSSGCFHQDVLTSWAMENAGTKVDAGFEESAKYLPQIDVDKNLWGCDLDWYRDWITHTDKDDPYWDMGFWGELREVPSRITKPIYVGEGWYDHHLGSALCTWQKLADKAKAHSTLRIGAWNHDFQPCTPGCEMEHLENSDTEQAYNWFCTILRDKKIPDMKVQTYTVHEDRWHERAGYPFAQGDKKEVFLGARGKLLDKPGEGGSVNYTFNPSDPVISNGAERLLYSWDQIGSLPQPKENWRSDVISFVSEPLASSEKLLGSIEVNLYVSSDAKDSAFAVKLMEVREDGRAYNIRSGIATLGYRKNPNGPRCDYIPNEIVPLKIKLWDIDWELKSGRRIRIDITSSDFPQFNIHTNYPGIWALQDKSQKASQTIYFGDKYPSNINFQVV